MTWGATGMVLAVTKLAYDNMQAKKIEKKQKEKDAVNQRLEEIKARNARAEQVQQMRIQQANAASQGQASGAGSSAVTGIQSSVSSQAASNIGNINTSLAGAAAQTSLNSGINKITRQTTFIGGLLDAGAKGAFALKADGDAKKIAAANAANQPAQMPS